jgi:hypothetical protein
MHGFEKIDLAVANLVNEALRVDPAGTVLTPPDSALQRLGLGAPVDAVPGNEASFFLALSPLGRWSGCVWAVCLDFGKGVPPTGVPYEVSPDLATGNALEVLRYWARNPGIDQKTVNDIVWSGQGLSVLRSQVVPDRLRKSSLAVADGQVFWLSGDGALHRLRGADWEAVGDGLDAVRAGFGMAVGSHRTLNGVRVFAASQGAWRFLLLPGIPAEVLPAPAFSVFARVEGSVYRFGPGSAEFVSACPYTAAGVALKASTHDPEICVLEAETGVVRTLGKSGVWRELPGTAALRISATAGSVYAVFASGLYRFQKRWTKVAEGADALYPGREVLYLIRGTRLYRYDEASDTIVELPSLQTHLLFLATDPAGDSLWVLDEKSSVWVFENSAWRFLVKVPGG